MTGAIPVVDKFLKGRWNKLLYASLCMFVFSREFRDWQQLLLYL